MTQVTDKELLVELRAKHDWLRRNPTGTATNDQMPDEGNGARAGKALTAVGAAAPTAASGRTRLS